MFQGVHGPHVTTNVSVNRVLVALSLGLTASTAAVACHESLTTSTRSETIATAEQRVAFLGKYLRLHSAVRDAAFAIDYHDNSGGMVPGPSDWTVWAGMMLPRGAMAEWLGGTHPCDQAPKFEMDKILPAAWKVSSPARCLHRDRATLLVHESEDVLVFYDSTL
jgi:hypothetical protein